MMSVKELYRDFTKSELMALCDELELDYSINDNSRVLVGKLTGDIEANGVPEFSDCSDTMAEFLVAAEYCNEAGELLGKAAEAAAPVAPVKYPDCIGFYDVNDPSCCKCKHAEHCKGVLQNTKPNCFGSHDKHAPECKLCLKSNDCQKG